MTQRRWCVIFCIVENSAKHHQLRLGEDDLAVFVASIPALYYGVNQLLDACAPALPRKVIVVLWALAGSTAEDEVGRYVTTSDIARTFRDWFVVSEGSVSSEVSKIKAQLFELNLIKIEGGRDHIHLSARGEEALRETLARATNLVEESLNALAPQERLALADFVRRMLSSKRKPPAKESPLGASVDAADVA